NDLNLFTLKVNHGGVFTYVYGPKRTRAPRRVYKGGNADWFDDVDADGFSVLEVSGMVKELDIDVLDMLSYVNKYKLMEVFIEHPVDNSVMDTIDLEQEDASAGLRNPDTTVKIDVERDYEPDSMTRQLRRIYVCLGALKSVDPNYEIYPLSYAIVKSVNKQAWLWFLDCLGDDLELFRNSNFTFVTDSQKGLILALAETFPAAEHRYCLKHIYDNMNLQWRGQQFKDLLWKCATATTVSYFNRNMEELKCANKELYDWLKLILAQQWARSHFSARPHCDVLLNNMIVIVQQVITKSNGPLTPKATKVFEVIKKLVAQYTISWNGGNLYQAVGPKGDQCVVNVEERACFCRKWDLIGMPCKHVVGAIWNMAENGLEPGIPESWVHPSYWLATWEEMYRPSKKRKKSAAELFDGLVKNGKLSRFGQTVTCCKCGKKGHNSRTYEGQGGATSAPAVNQTQTTQTTVNPSAPAVNPSQTTQTTVNSPSQTSPTMRYTKQKSNQVFTLKNINASGSGKRKAGG
nr:hypothetical protein [Tanacetum cinerariifolium]